MQLSRSRPRRHEHFLNRAKVVAEMSTCLRRKIGAIIVARMGLSLGLAIREPQEGQSIA